MKHTQGYCIAFVLISKFSDCHSFLLHRVPVFHDTCGIL